MGKLLQIILILKNLAFNLVGIFDVNPKLIGLKIRDVEVIDIDELVEFLKATPIDIGVICVSKNSAQIVSDMLVAKWG